MRNSLPTCAGWIKSWSSRRSLRCDARTKVPELSRRKDFGHSHSAFSIEIDSLFSQNVSAGTRRSIKAKKCRTKLFLFLFWLLPWFTSIGFSRKRLKPTQSHVSDERLVPRNKYEFSLVYCMINDRRRQSFNSEIYWVAVQTFTTVNSWI